MRATGASDLVCSILSIASGLIHPKRILLAATVSDLRLLAHNELRKAPEFPDSRRKAWGEACAKQETQSDGRVAASPVLKPCSRVWQAL